jgi:hypothetical protein
MSARTFAKALTLIYGTLLAPGRRTISSALRVQGLCEENNFGKYHRVLNRDRWSPMRMSPLLLGLLIDAFVPDGMALVLLIDETLERRSGKQIVYKSWFRDAVRCVGKKVAVSLGIRWCCVCLLVSVPWSSRLWALPFLAVPVLSEKACQRLKKPHRSGVEWAALLMETIRLWQPEREIILVGDGGYAAVELVATCKRLDVKMVSRLRLDASLFAFPAPQPVGKRGPKPKKGARQPRFKERLLDPNTKWQSLLLRWYGGQEKRLEYVSGVSLWYTPGQAPVPIRWVLTRYEEEDRKTGKKKTKAAAFFSSDTSLKPEQILAHFLQRWNMEVTFEEIRAHLGLETQRHWSKRAIGRTTPCLFGLFSLAVLMAKTRHPHALPVQQSRWYQKEEATFSDVLAAVRLHLWSAMNNTHSPQNEPMCLIPSALWNHIQHVAAYAA